MKILIACEYSGRVRDAFAARGHDVLSCDFEESEAPGPHFKGDVLELIGHERFDMMIAFPPCTYLCRSGIQWNSVYPGRTAKTEDAIRFVRELWSAPIKLKALENPVGVLSTRFRQPDQIIQPYQFGENASKATCLWLDGLPQLRPTEFHPPQKRVWKGRVVERWANQLDSGANRVSPGADRWKERSRTYPGVAAAMAAQWSDIV